jgi:hypothetical protein
MTAERVYAALLLLYPRGFRREYGGAMIDAFRDLHAARRGSPAAFWWFVARDICTSAAGQRVDALPFVARWMAVCGLGASVMGWLANVVAWSIGYLYHPYLEGLRLEPWHVGALLGGTLGAVQALALPGRSGARGRWVLATTGSASLGMPVALAIGAGVVGSGLILGAIVGTGQWLVLRPRAPGAGWWATASAGALAGGVLAYGAAMQRALAGMNPLPNEALVLRVVPVVPHVPQLAAGIAVMATAGLIIGALTARPVSRLCEE